MAGRVPIQANAAPAFPLPPSYLHQRRAAPDAKVNDIKALLGKMLFNGAGMEKQVRLPMAFIVLSGSFWSRQALCVPHASPHPPHPTPPPPTRTSRPAC